MFLRNYYKCLALYNFTPGGNSDSGVPVTTLDGVQRNLRIDCADVKLNNSGTTYPYIGRLLTSTKAGVIIGTGDTPVTFDDCYVSGEQITTFSETHTVTYNFDETGCEVTSVFSITNTGDSDFTIKEIGLIGGSPFTDNYTRYMMFERTVLDTPVTIAAGGVGQVTYTIRFDFPTA